jgi:hypothetical protein
VRTTNILSGVAFAIWLALGLNGRTLLSGAVAQQAPGFPNSGQIDYYLAIPLLVAISILVVAWVCSAIKRLSWVQLILSVFALIALPVYMLAYTGGM